MARVFFNKPIILKEGIVWSAMNGATRRSLQIFCNLLIAPTGKPIDTMSLECQLGVIDEYNRSIININHQKPGDNRILGIFLNDSCGYTVVEGDELFSGTSVGGYGNSSSRFGVYKVGAILKCATYKNRRTPTYNKLEVDGWKVENHFENTIKEI